MKNYKLHISEGFKDTYGVEMLVKKEIENRILDLFKLHGYEHIKTPQLEYIDVYSENGVQKPDLYNLINRQGEVLTLCNDMTASIARFVCSNKNLKDTGVKKYCYVADTFRYPRLYQGKNHQFLQAGVELIGENGLYSDIECIYLAYKAMKKCNVTEFKIHLGSSEFLNALFNDFKISNDIQTAIYAAIENKDYVTLKQILNDNLDKEKTKFIIDLMIRGGHLRYLEGLMNHLEGTNSYHALCYLKDIYTGLKELGIENIIFDFSIYSYAKYYTGIIFAIYVDGVKKSLISGGRADSLFANYGKNYPDIGFGLDVDQLTEYVMNKKLIEVSILKYLSVVTSGDVITAFMNNDNFINQGIIVNHCYYDNLTDALSYAKENGYDKVIEYNNNEVKIKEV